MKNGAANFSWIVLGIALPMSVAAQTPPAAPAAGDITVNGSVSTSFTPLSGGPDFISPMGEPFHSIDKLSGAEHWFEQADTSHNGRLTLAEFHADAARFFATLDTDHDGDIGPIEIERYENDIAPEVKVTNTYGDVSKVKVDSDGKVQDPPYPVLLGAGRYGYLPIPEPVVYADTNFDRAISRREFDIAADQRFKKLDLNGDGAITRDELPKLRSVRDDNGR